MVIKEGEMLKIKYLAMVTAACTLCLLVVGNCQKKISNSSNLSKSKSSDFANRKLAIYVEGNKFRNGQGEVIQLRGVNLMGMEYTAIGGWWPQDPFFTVVESTWPALHDWHVNSIRIPLNETSYLGIKCIKAFTGPAYNKSGEVQESDPGHNYRARLREVVDRATKEGLYIILDMHLSAPSDPQNQVDNVSAQCATDANPLPDADHAIAFWTDLASAYKNYPNVIFELFNNPYIDQWRYFKGSKTEAWKALRDGTVVNSYLPLWPTRKKHLWRSVGVQQLIDVIRATGATNVILQGSLSKSADIESWTTYKALDPIGQTAATWHAFPRIDLQREHACYIYPSPWCDERAYSYAQLILDQNFPVVVTEFGDDNMPGTVGAPFASSLLPHLDSMGISYLAWTFTVTTMKKNQLIKDNLGTPTDGYGQYVKEHYACRAAFTACSNLDTNKQLGVVDQQPPSANSNGWTPSVPPI